MTKSQQKEIDLGIKNGVDVHIYNKPEFSAKKMHEIRMGLEEGLNVNLYAHPEYDVEKMEVYRMCLRMNIEYTDELLYDLNGQECSELFSLFILPIDSEYNYDLSNPIDREMAKKVAIERVANNTRMQESEQKWQNFLDFLER